MYFFLGGGVGERENLWVWYADLEPEYGVDDVPDPLELLDMLGGVHDQVDLAPHHRPHPNTHLLHNNRTASAITTKDTLEDERLCFANWENKNIKMEKL